MANKIQNESLNTGGDKFLKFNLNSVVTYVICAHVLHLG